MNVKYCGPIADYSGYGETSRHHVAALEAAGVNVDVKMVSYTPQTSDFGKIGKLARSLVDRDLNSKILMLHTTPDVYRRHMEADKYHIGLFYWETDLVPDQYAEGLKFMDEIWTAAEATKQAIQAAGIKAPIYVIPQPIETIRPKVEPYEIEDFKGYMFYSIFEWTDRKNPDALLESYWREFAGVNNVGLLIKTYFRDFTLINRRMIYERIRLLKSRLTEEIKEFPQVFLYTDLMDRHHISRLHETADCFVSAHRGEGWGVPQVEAALAGNLVISTGYNGCHEYFDQSNSIMLPYEMVDVRGMHHSNLYTRPQKWADVDQKALREAMRWAYQHKTAAKNKGKKARAHVKTEFNLKRVGKLMADRLEQVK